MDSREFVGILVVIFAQQSKKVPIVSDWHFFCSLVARLIGRFTVDAFILVLGLVAALGLFGLAAITNLIRRVPARKSDQLDGSMLRSDSWSLDDPPADQVKSDDRWVLG